MVDVVPPVKVLSITNVPEVGTIVKIPVPLSKLDTVAVAPLEPVTTSFALKVPVPPVNPVTNIFIGKVNVGGVGLAS